MQAQEFLTVVRDEAIAAVPESLRDLRSRIRYGMLQLHYADPANHYEVWLVRKTGRIEIGLHFEGERESNHLLASALAEQTLELREAIGPDIEIEEWSPSWTRLHLTVPLRPLAPSLASEVSSRLASIVRITGESLLHLEAGPAAAAFSARGGGSRHWKGHRRGPSRVTR